MARLRGKNSEAIHSATEKSDANLVVHEDEQWRLIRESGVLQKIGTTHPKVSNEDGSEPGEEMFNAVLLIIPFSFLLLMMDILIHFQYGKDPPLRELVERMLAGVPILSVFIFYTTRYKQHRRMQIFLFTMAIVVGCRMLFIINRKSWLVNMRQCPPLATLWIYTIVQLELGPATLSLITVGGFVWWKGLRLSF